MYTNQKPNVCIYCQYFFADATTGVCAKCNRMTKLKEKGDNWYGKD